MKLSPEEKRIIKEALKITASIYEAHVFLTTKQRYFFANVKYVLYRFENNGERPPKY